MVTSIVVFIFYYLYITADYNSEAMTFTDELHFWGSAILILIPVQIVTKVISYIVFVIVNTIATRELEPSITDEFEKLIDLKATRNFYHVFITGFFLAMGSLVFKMPPSVMFNIFLFSLVIGGITIDLSQLYFYRRGI